MHVTPPPHLPNNNNNKNGLKTSLANSNRTCMHVYLNFYEKYIIGNMANVLTIQPPS